MMSIPSSSSYHIALHSSTIWKKKQQQQQLISFSTIRSECLKKLLLRGLAGTLAFTLLSSSPPPLSAAELLPPSAPSSELCREDSEEYVEERPSESVSNKELVEEAWEVVNESFLGHVGNRNWSPELWRQEKEYMLQKNIQTRARAHEVIRKMLGSLGDPYTRFLSPQEFSKMARYDVSGIGINLREVPDDYGATKLKVLGIILDGPAYSVGVRQLYKLQESSDQLFYGDRCMIQSTYVVYNLFFGDELLSVNGVDVKGKSAFDVSTLLQGPKETFVTIEVKHGKCGPVQSIKVQRQPVARTPVFYRLDKMDNGGISVGYVQIKEFNALAKKDLIIALKRLKDSGASYMILDLRDNLGGLVQVGIEVAKLFLNKGDTVIYTAGRDPQIQNSIVAETAPFITSPVVVLVNNRTASASEIVAAALHDNCKAVLVGEKTFGKGLIQSVYELHDGSGVVVTIGKYVTPNHMDINGNGIVPDYQRLPDLSEATNYLSRCQIQRT